MVNVTLNSLKATPSTVGAGTVTTGGRGGIVVHVTNLNDSGSGSLREALLMTVPRIIVFDVSGRIHLSSILELIEENSDFTVAGQTAPQGGITISGKPILMGGGYNRSNQPCNNAIWKHIRFRNGSYTGVPDVYLHNGFLSTGTDGLVLDHCSFSFNDDQAIGMNGNYGPVDNITVQNCLFSENGTSVITDGSSTGNVFDLTFYRNLWKNDYHRQPNYGGVGQVDIINNIHDNFPSRIVNINKTGSKDVNYIGNWIRTGPTSTTEPPNKIQTSNGTDATVYTANNYHNTLKSVPALNDRVEIWSDFTNSNPLSSSYFTTTIHPLLGTAPVIENVFDAFDTITNDVGANRFVDNNGNVSTYLDSYDTQLISDTINGVQGPLGNKSWTQPILPNNTRPGNFYSSVDGIPEFFCQQHGITSNNQIITDWNFGTYLLKNNANYTAIEIYAAWVANEFNFLINQDNVASDSSYTISQIPDTDVLTLNTLKAFPTAHGPGSIATGGRGGDLIIVDTLNFNTALSYDAVNDVYTGGFLAAMQHPSPAHIIFDVSGDIHQGNIGAGWYDGYEDINNKSILGQTAPRGGITITDRSFKLSGRFGDNKNLIFRHLRSRPIYNRDGIITLDDDAFTWSLLFYGGENIIVDHCSLSFAQDKALGAYIDQNVAINGHGLYNLTFQYNFIQESGTGAYVEINPNRPEDPEEMVDGIAFNKNVFVSVNRTPNLAFSGKGEKINNIIHDTPSKNTSTYHTCLLNVQNNYYQRQGVSPDKIRADVNDNTSGDPLVYTKGNIFNGTVGGVSVNLTGNLSEDNTVMWSTLDATVPAPSNYFTNTRHNHNFPNPTVVKTAQESFTELITDGNIGAFRYVDDSGNLQIYRDPYDTSQLAVVANNQSYTKSASNFVLPAIPSNTRPLNWYNSIYGIPEFFVQQHNITSRNQVITNWNFGNYQMVNTAGYTAIEVYTAWAAGDFDYLISQGNVAEDTSYTITSATGAAPVISLIGSSEVNVTLGDPYVELGATATDIEDGDISADIVIGGDTVDTNSLGTYTITYNVTDSNSNSAVEVTRTVNVINEGTVIKIKNNSIVINGRKVKLYLN